MSPNDFVIWLKGVTDALSAEEPPTQERWQRIVDQLKQVPPWVNPAPAVWPPLTTPTYPVFPTTPTPTYPVFSDIIPHRVTTGTTFEWDAKNVSLS